MLVEALEVASTAEAPGAAVVPPTKRCPVVWRYQSNHGLKLKIISLIPA
ncbi:TPA: hypothetical protein U5Z37_001593 [Streptococcus agalactiae]|nr:hypothetical protein [Streptococcus agalactiae]HEN4434271.1 hypothetical protein [Streptococcus agalactiae]HEN4442519.1 hypothetical protein [Streptococcus agalactiae]HEN4479638.1 hypothetical protein [Streptococcus agalactiae]HEN4484321.1 hypothetical protein [Streptococcus agalactiae]